MLYCVKLNYSNLVAVTILKKRDFTTLKLFQLKKMSNIRFLKTSF